VRRRYDWVFLDAGETLFQVSSPADSFGEVLAELGYRVPAGRLASAVAQARVKAMAPDHLEPGPEYAISAERARARRGRLIAEILRSVGVREADFEVCRAAVWESFAGPRFFGLYPEVPEVLATLRTSGYRLGIISNWEPRLELLCRNHGLADHFAFVLASEAEGFAKPGPRLFRRALELAQVEPSRAVHVGDSYEHDVLGAAAVGIDSVLLDRGGYYPPGRWQPTIRSLDELPGVLSEGIVAGSQRRP
jgi:REG-2-like HAD superfamily hydrolase